MKTRERRKSWLFVSCGLLLATLAGCGREVVVFNNTISDANARIGKEAASFGEALSPLFKEGKKPDVKVLQEKYDAVAKGIEAVKEKTEGLQVPEAAQGAEELLAAHKKFVEAQQKLVNEDLKQILEVAKNADLSTDEMKDQIEKLLAQVRAGEAKVLSPLQAAQRKFAEENGFKLQKAK